MTQIVSRTIGVITLFPGGDVMRAYEAAQIELIATFFLIM